MSRYPTRWLVPVAAAAVALAGALWWAGSGDGSPPGSAPGRAASEFSASGAAAPAAPGPAHAAAPARSWPALDVLHGWDRARARAYAAGDVAALRSLYVAGSSAGTSDVRLLRSYLRRGLRVRGMRMQVLAVEVVAHAAGQWRLRVTDRLTGAVAAGDDVRLPLPRDMASTRIIELRLRDDSWEVASVRQPLGVSR